MPRTIRSQLLYLLLALLALAGVIAWNMRRAGTRPPPNAPGYNMGVQMNKAGTAYTTEDGTVVPTPPGAPEPPNKGRPGGPFGGR